MIIEFPKPLITVAERKQQQLYDLLEFNAEIFFSTTGIELTEDQLEQLAWCYDDILTEEDDCII
jgi:hypothetical protein